MQCPKHSGKFCKEPKYKKIGSSVNGTDPHVYSTNRTTNNHNRRFTRRGALKRFSVQGRKRNEKALTMKAVCGRIHAPQPANLASIRPSLRGYGVDTQGGMSPPLAYSNRDSGVLAFEPSTDLDRSKTSPQDAQGRQSSLVIPPSPAVPEKECMRRVHQVADHGFLADDTSACWR